MHISARSDYAVRAMLTLAAHHPEHVTTQRVAEEQQMPRKYLESILTALGKAGLVQTKRGAEGGHRLAAPPEQITVGQVLRSMDGPLAQVRGLRPDQTEYHGAAVHLPELWVAARAALRSVLDETSIADVAAGRLPPPVRSLCDLPDAWVKR